MKELLPSVNESRIRIASAEGTQQYKVGSILEIAQYLELSRNNDKIRDRCCNRHQARQPDAPLNQRTGQDAQECSCGKRENQNLGEDKDKVDRLFLQLQVMRDKEWLIADQYMPFALDQKQVVQCDSASEQK